MTIATEKYLSTGVIVPTWMHVLNGLIITILLFKTYASTVHPEWLFGTAPLASDTAAGYAKALAELCGRNLSMIAVSLAALWWRNAAWYRAVFLLALVREGFDMVLVVWFGGTTALSQAATFLVFLLPYIKALHTLSQEK